MIDTARRDRLRAEVAAHRAAALGLREKIVDGTTKTLLGPVLNTLNDVDSVFLASINNDRTVEQEKWWLDWAERWLQVPALELHAITELIQKYGGPEKVRTI